MEVNDVVMGLENKKQLNIYAKVGLFIYTLEQWFQGPNQPQQKEPNLIWISLGRMSQGPNEQLFAGTSIAAELHIAYPLFQEQNDCQ